MSGSTPNRRSRFGLVGLTALVVVGALLIILAFLRSTSAESRPACKTGKQELDGGFARAAAQTYKQERTKSDATCVREGLRDSVLALCALGGTFIHSGLYAQAKATFFTLGRFGRAVKTAVPSLVESLKDSDMNLR